MRTNKTMEAFGAVPIKGNRSHGRPKHKGEKMSNGAYQSHKNFVVTVGGSQSEKKREYEFLTYKTAYEFWQKIQASGKYARLCKLEYKSGSSEPEKIPIEHWQKEN